MNPLQIIGRDKDLFGTDVDRHSRELASLVSSSRFLVVGGAGSIGQAVTKELFRRNPAILHVVDLSENNLAELVRDLRSSQGYIDGSFETFAIDVDSREFDALVQQGGGYDYVLNLSALKHVRSEKDPFTLMRLIRVNILNSVKIAGMAQAMGARKFFCVSTDKAANPVNMMGASKRIMEMFLARQSRNLAVSMARFANVAFSDGSLLHSFNQRIQKGQPIVAPGDVRRYFVTPRESGELCLMSCLLGHNLDIYFPKLDPAAHLLTFAEIAERYLARLGYTPLPCRDEDEARALAARPPDGKRWPCLLTTSDTTGEKDQEEFHTGSEVVDLGRYDGIGVILHSAAVDEERLRHFEERIAGLLTSGWDKKDLVRLFLETIPGFSHTERGKFLDGKM